MHKNLLLSIFAILCLANITYGQEDDELKEYYERLNANKKLFALKVGAGIGAKYGGWAGMNGEFDIGIVGISFGGGFVLPNTVIGKESITSDLTEFGWQAGLKFYLLPKSYTIRPTINVFCGSVYPYYIQLSNYQKKGKYLGFTPSLIIEHDLGKTRKVSLSYGLGAVFYEKMPDRDADIIKNITGKENIINLSFICGVNFNIL